MTQKKFEFHATALNAADDVEDRERCLEDLEKHLIKSVLSFPYSSCVSGKGSEVNPRSASPLFFTAHTAPSDSDLYDNPDESKKPGGPT